MAGIHQICNLGSGPRRCPINFGDDYSREQWDRKCSEQLAGMSKQGIQYTVTPSCSVHLPDGRWLPEGAAVTAQDFQGGNVPALTLLNQALNKGLLLEGSAPIEPGPEAA